MIKKNFNLLQYLAFFGFGIFLIWWSAKNINEAGWLEIRNSLLKIKFWYFLPVAVLLICSHWLRGLRWRLLIEPLGFQPKKSNTFFAVMIGYLANLAIPRLGEVLKCTIITRYDKVPADKLIGTMLLERLIDVICLLLVFLLLLFSQSHLINSFLQKVFLLQNENSFEFGVNSFVFLLLFFLLPIITFIFFKNKFSNNLLIVKLKKILSGVWQGFLSIRNVSQKRLFFIHTFLIWFLYLSSTYLGFLALEETSLFGFNEALAVLVFGSVGIILTPGGFGGYPFMVQQTLMIYGLNANIGWAFGMITWIAQTFVVVFFGLLSFVLLPFINKKKNGLFK